MIRRFRIAVSAFFAVLTLFLCVLSVRSYSTCDAVHAPTSGTGRLEVMSSCGQITFSMSRVWGEKNDFEWSAVPGLRIRAGLPSLLRTFKWYSVGTVTSLTFSNRLLFVVSSALAAVPWLPWPRQCSLRTLFIVMTTVAVLLLLWFAI